jgi:uncharacterized surface protein with fasciclin (FAS1) repeats
VGFLSPFAPLDEATFAELPKGTVGNTHKPENKSN